MAKHTCRRATNPATKRLYPDKCVECARIVAANKAAKETAPVTTTPVPAEPEVGTPPTFVEGHEPETGPDMPPPNPIEVVDPEATAIPEQTEGAELNPTDSALEQAKALLRMAGLTVIDPEEVRAEMAAGNYAASVMAPAAWQAEVNEPVIVYERDYANGIVQKLRDESGIYYVYNGKRYRKSVATERQLLPNGQYAPLIEGYSYTLYP